jgi:DNA-binding LytR/AlgR family response regulator
MENKPLIRCIVLDDEFLAVKLVAGYVEQTEGLQLVLQTTKVAEVIVAVQRGMADLLFLDVQMPGLTGLELMQMIRYSDIKVILTTAYAQYAIDGFENDVVDYLLKPITYERFLVAVHKAKTRLINSPHDHKATDFLFVKTEYRLQKVMLSDILYLEGLRDYIAFHLKTGKILSLERMKNMEELLPAEGFLRIHKSYLINISHISYIERGRIIINKDYLPVGETYKEAVKQRLKI